MAKGGEKRSVTTKGIFCSYEGVRRGSNRVCDSAEKPPSFERTNKNTKNESSRETSRID
jgi:hypothetical protein